MPYYHTVGEIPPKRHMQFRRPDGSLYVEELMRKEGFSFASALLYHRYDVDPSRETSCRAKGRASRRDRCRFTPAGTPTDLSPRDLGSGATDHEDDGYAWTWLEGR